VVTFSIGGITLGSAVGQPQLTPIDLVPGAIDATDQQVTNILRFVQSLDADSDPSCKKRAFFPCSKTRLPIGNS
jgi:hypothetical protein